MIVPSAISAANATVSDRVGCGWIVRPTSSASAPISIARHTSAISSPAFGPTIPAPRIWRDVGSTRSFAGSIWQLSPVVNQQNRQGIARIALAYDPSLRPGGFASVNIVAGSQEAPVLPESAILSDDKGNFVYVVDKGNRAQRRPVRTGTVTPAGIAVIEGLRGNEMVVLRAGGFLNPGDKVRPQRQKS